MDLFKSTKLGGCPQHLWQGVPSLYELGNELVGTLAPGKGFDETYYGQLTVFDWSNRDIAKVVSIPLFKIFEFSGQ